MKLAIPFLVIIFQATAATAWSQNVTPAKVPAPPANARWSIDFSREDKKRKEGPADAEVDSTEIRRKEFTLTGDTALVKETFADGFSRELYQVGNLQLFHPRGSRHIIVLDITDQPTPDQLFRRVFPGLDWVAPQYFHGATEAFGKPCLYYKSTTQLASVEADDNPAQVAREAWVSQETGLPVAFKWGGVTGKYTFLTPSTAKVELPEEFRKYLDENLRTGPPPGQTSSLLKTEP
jgi:hypothetical protein